MDVSELERGLKAVSRQRDSVRIELGSDWSRCSGLSDTAAPGYTADHSVRVDPDGLVQLPPGSVRQVDPSRGSELVSDGDHRRMTPDDIVVVEADLRTLVRAHAGGTVRRRPDQTVVVTSGEVSIGWDLGRDRDHDAPSAVAVDPKDIRSVADGIAALSVALPATESPQRTWPGLRVPTPTLATDGDGVVPDDVDRVDTGISITLPRESRREYLVAVATLAHYLDAEIEFGGEAELHAGTTWDLDDGPETVDAEASRLLRRVFYLDCLVRSEGPYGTNLHRSYLLEDHGIDATALFDASLADRVDRYLALDATVDDRLPEWPHAACVKPDRLGSVAHHLDRLSDVQLPRPDRLDTVGAQVEWGADQRVRGSGPTVPSTVVVPETATHTTTWDADGTPFGATDHSTPSPTPLSEDDLEVVVARADEYGDGQVVDRVEEIASRSPMTVREVRDPSVDEVADLLESDIDLLHLAAHADESGVRLRDGSLGAGRVGSLTVDCQTVVANACESHRWGRGVVRGGAAAAIVTTGAVPDPMASRAGARIAGLLARGWSVERTVDLVRRLSDPTGYLVVGDAGHRVTRSDSRPEPPLVELDTDAGKTCITATSPHAPGWRVFGPLTEDRRLPGAWTVQFGDETEVRERLRSTMDSPVVVDGELCWPSEL